MLLLSRQLNESLVIKDGIVITVLEVRGDTVRMRVTTPTGMCVHRLEDLAAAHGPWPRPELDPAWLVWQDGTIPRLARSIAENRDYQSLPILADALEEAGCADTIILGHCRSVRKDSQCSWVVDLILS